VQTTWRTVADAKNHSLLYKKLKKDDIMKISEQESEKLHQSAQSNGRKKKCFIFGSGEINECFNSHFN
jgi:hypothetical protein